MLCPPVDLSFKDIEHLTATLVMKPRSTFWPLKTNWKMKYLSRSLRLSNNSISDLSNLRVIVSHFLAEPLKLGWLDLSFNKITFIDPVLCELRDLRVLYLHGNAIEGLSEVDKLGELQHLHSITLHGNEIEEERDYRRHVVSVLPQLKRMDFSAVTRVERELANVWRQSTDRCKTPKETLQ